MCIGRLEIAATGLLTKDDPSPVTAINPDGASRVVLTCEHAGNAVPGRLDALGLGDADLDRHIAWDIGAATTARCLAEIIDAPLVLQHYSRLVIDCNRPTDAEESIPLVSDGTRVPGNGNVSETEREARIQEIHDPFHRAIGALLDARIERDAHPVLISVHTFTPTLEVNPEPRPWDLGLLYNRDDRLAQVFERVLGEMEHAFGIAHNEPYSVCDETDYTIPVHGEGRGINSLLLEIRNDHVRDDNGVGKWGDFLGHVVTEAVPSLIRM